jgi:hypothetical protein
MITLISGQRCCADVCLVVTMGLISASHRRREAHNQKARSLYEHHGRRHCTNLPNHIIRGCKSFRTRIENEDYLQAKRYAAKSKMNALSLHLRC